MSESSAAAIPTLSRFRRGRKLTSENPISCKRAECGDKAVADAAGAVSIGAEDDRIPAAAASASIAGPGLISATALLTPLVLSFQRDAGRGDAIERALDVRPDTGEVPVRGRFVFHQIGMRQRVERAGLAACARCSK